MLFTAVHVHPGEQQRNDPPGSCDVRGLLVSGEQHIHVVRADLYRYTFMVPADLSHCLLSSFFQIRELFSTRESITIGVFTLR